MDTEPLSHMPSVAPSYPGYKIANIDSLPCRYSNIKKYNIVWLYTYAYDPYSPLKIMCHLEATHDIYLPNGITLRVPVIISVLPQ